MELGDDILLIITELVGRLGGNVVVTGDELLDQTGELVIVEEDGQFRLQVTPRRDQR